MIRLLILAALLPLVALAQSVAGPEPVRSLDVFATLSALSVVIVIAVVRAARAALPWLTRDDARAKLACQGIGLATAIGCAMLKIGPSVDPLAEAHPLVAQVAGGVVVAALASWGRDGLARLPGAVAGPSK